MKPNIFDYATSELSQDAFFAYLMNWADPKYKSTDTNLNKLGEGFVKLLIHTKDKSFSKVNNINVLKQWNKIDIAVEVNSKYFIIIEDKINTTKHSDQLARYKELAESHTKNSEIIIVPIYLKTATFSRNEVKDIEDKEGYSVITRTILLDFFTKHTNVNNVFIEDYILKQKNVLSIENSFREIPIDDWNKDGFVEYRWIGFMNYLDHKLLIDGGWDYVPNARGGFYGFWWFFHQYEDYHIYLQIEEQKLCFKLGEIKVEKKFSARDFWYWGIINYAKEKGFTEIVKPSRLGAGATATVAIAKEVNWLGKTDEVLNLEQVVKNLKKYETFLSDLMKSVTN